MNKWLTKAVNQCVVLLRGYRWSLLLLPVLTLLLMFFLVPMCNMARIAFLKYDPIRLYMPIFTTGNFAKFFGDYYYWGMLLNSLKIGVLTSLFSLLLGYPIAYYLTRSKGTERTILTGCILLPIFTTVVIIALGWYVIFLPYGLAQKLLAALGITSGPIKVLRTSPMLIAVLVHAHIPYAIMILASSIQAVPEEKLQAARVLGAPDWRVIWSVMIPLTMPGIVSSAILVFSLSASSYLIPALITGHKIKLLPIAIWSYTSELLNWPFASAIALVLFIVTLSVTYGFIVTTNKLSRRGQWEVV